MKPLDSALSVIETENEVMCSDKWGNYKYNKLYVSNEGTLYIEIKTSKAIVRGGYAGKRRVLLGSLPMYIHEAPILLKLCNLRVKVLAGQFDIGTSLLFAKYLYEKGIINEDL